MGNLSSIGRIFYGVSMAALGLVTVYYADFPYMLIPPKHSFTGLAPIAYASGVFLILAGVSIAFGKRVRPISLVSGGVLLLVFVFYFIPYQLLVSKNNMHFGDWENAMKELTLVSGAFVVAGCFSEKNESTLMRFLGKLVPFGAILYSITIISYSIDHFLYAEQAADYVPSWMPYHVLTLYVTGAALLGSGLAIILKIKIKLTATLLGAMIFTWFLVLHIPRVIVSPKVYLEGEITSAFLALAYGGIAFVIAGTVKRN